MPEKMEHIEIGYLYRQNFQKIKKSENLSLLSVKPILSFLDPTKRLLLSLTYPRFSKIEKKIPLELCHIAIRPAEIQFEKKRFIFKNGRITLFDSKNSNRFYKFTRYINSFYQDSTDAVLKVFFVLFVGRANLRTITFESKVEIPMDLKIDVSLVLVAPEFHRLGIHSGNIFRKVDCVMFMKLQSADDIRYSWIQNSERLDFLRDGHNHLIAELPNLCAKTIFIHMRRTEGCLELIKEWIKNKKTEDHSTIYLTFVQCESAFDIFNSHELREMGFVKTNVYRLRLSLANKMEARLLCGVDIEDVSFRYWDKTRPYHRYLSIEIAKSDYPFDEDSDFRY